VKMKSKISTPHHFGYMIKKWYLKPSQHKNSPEQKLAHMLYAMKFNCIK
jgi:hypothetical protein